MTGEVDQDVVLLPGHGDEGVDCTLEFFFVGVEQELGREAVAIGQNLRDRLGVVVRGS